jgi:aspartate dehydrogenase
MTFSLGWHRNQQTMTDRKRLRVVCIGWGAINRRVADLLARRGHPIDIVGVCVASTGRARPPLPDGATLVTSAGDVAALNPDLVVEAAGRKAVAQWAPTALAAAKTLIVASTSAFCDDTLLPRLIEIADEHGSRIVIPSGAIGGIDALASANVLQLDDVLHQMIKPPLAWAGTPAEQRFVLAELRTRTVIFSGSAREAASQFPQNANASVVTSLAGLGIDRTRVELVADPAATTNAHRIVASGAAGRMDILLENLPLATNPKSSELTALNLVHLIERQTATVTF